MKSNISFSKSPQLLIPFLFSLLFSFSMAYADTSATDSTSPQAININQADAQTIAKNLKGIGLKKAEAIVDYRERYGEFAHIDELVAVKGIGKGTLSKNVHLLRLE